MTRWLCQFLWALEPLGKVSPPLMLMATRLAWCQDFTLDHDPSQAHVNRRSRKTFQCNWAVWAEHWEGGVAQRVSVEQVFCVEWCHQPVAVGCVWSPLWYTAGGFLLTGLAPLSCLWSQVIFIRELSVGEDLESTTDCVHWKSSKSYKPANFHMWEFIWAF